MLDECINCGACEPECPNTAIYEGAFDWKYADGTSLNGEVVLPNGKASKTGSIVYIEPQTTLAYTQELQNLIYDEKEEIDLILATTRLVFVDEQAQQPRSKT